MNLQLDKHYSNKTWRFLFPCLRAYGEEFMKKIATVSIMAVGCGYKELDTSASIHILYDKKFSQKALFELLAYLHKKDLLVEVYSFDPDMRDGLRSMVVVKLPEEFHQSYQHFIKGEYSKMFTDEELVKYFSFKLWSKEMGILTRVEKHTKNFLKVVNEMYRTTLKLKDTKNWEYEFPLNLKEEIFNYERLQEEAREIV